MGEDRNFKKILRRENLRNTSHRNSVLEIMESSDEPVSAESLYLALQGKGVSISLSTVYRVLDALVGKEIIIRTDIKDSNKSMYEMNRRDHKHHLVCVKCRKIIPVEDCPFGDFEKRLEESSGFHITGHRLEMYGYCGKCKEEDKG